MTPRSLARRVLRPLRALRPPQPVILMYHRVAAVDLDPWELAVPPARFASQMAAIRARRTPLPMDEFVRRHRERTLPANAIAVTFDDGYRDNLLLAKPILDHFQVPATLFLSTGPLGQPNPYWWDELASMILASPSPLELNDVYGGYRVQLRWGKPEEADLNRLWRAAKEPLTARQRAYLSTWRDLKLMAAPLRSEVMAALRDVLPQQPDPLGMPMSWPEVETLLQGNVFTLGGHTVTHASLSSLNGEEQAAEIQQNVAACRSFLGQPVRGFAYPYGDNDESARHQVEASGLDWACTTVAAFVDQHSAKFALPRISGSDAHFL